VTVIAGFDAVAALSNWAMCRTKRGERNLTPSPIDAVRVQRRMLAVSIHKSGIHRGM
jgi:hypothetical protein